MCVCMCVYNSIMIELFVYWSFTGSLCSGIWERLLYVILEIVIIIANAGKSTNELEVKIFKQWWKEAWPLWLTAPGEGSIPWAIEGGGDMI